METVRDTRGILRYINGEGRSFWTSHCSAICSTNTAFEANRQLAYLCWTAGLIEATNEGWLCDTSALKDDAFKCEWAIVFASPFQTREQMLSYARSVYIQYTNTDVAVDDSQEWESYGENSATVQTFVAAASRVISILPRRFGQWFMEGALGTCSQVFDKVKDIFFSVLGGYTPIIRRWCDWIDTFWSTMSTKAKEFYDSALSGLRGFEESFYWGLSLVAAVSLIACIERFLVAMGLLANPINLVSLLIPAILAAFCIVQSTNFLCDKLEEMNSLFSFFCSKYLVVIPESLFPGFFTQTPRDHRRPDSSDSGASGDSASVQFAPVALLESFSNMLVNMNAKSFVEMGRVASAFNSVHTAVGGIKSTSQTILTGLWKVLDSVFGIQSQALATLSVTLGCDVEGWLSECDAMEEYFIQYGKVDMGMLKRVRKLCHRGRCIQKVLMEEGRGVAPAIASIVHKSLERLQLLQKQMALRGVTAVRKMPFVVAFTGKSRTGKSIIARKFAEDLCDLEGLDSDQIYSRQGTDPFWSGYRKEFVTMYDDFAAVPNSCCKSDEIELMPLVSLDPVSLNMASLEEKGNVFFESEAIIYSSNFVDASPRSEVMDFEAFQNRRHVLIEVERHPDPTRVYNGYNVLECQRYKILHRNNFHVILTLDSYEDLWAYLTNKWNDHNAEQVANLATFKKTRNTLRTPMRSLLEIIRPGELGLPSDLLSMMRQKDCYFITNLGQRVFAVQEGGRYIDLPYAGDGVLPIYGGMERVVQTIEGLHNVGTLNPLVIHYLGVLTRKKWLNEDLTWAPIACDLDDYIKEVVDALEPAHKAILFCLQYHFARDKEDNTWYKRSWSSVKEHLSTIFYKEVSAWPTPLKIVVGGALVLALGATFWVAMKFLVSKSGSAAFGSVGASVFVATTQSRQPNRNEGAEYRLRNVPAKVRHWNSNTSGSARVGMAKVSGKHWGDYEDDGDFGPIPTFAQSQDATITADTQYIMTRMHANLEVGSQTYQVMILPGKRLLLCNHFVASWRHRGQSFFCKVALNTGRTYMHLFKMANVQTIEGSELSVYSDKTLEDIPHSMWKTLCTDVEANCGKTISALFLTLRPDILTGNLEYTYAPIAVRMRTHSLTVNGLDYVREVPKALEYKVPTENYDCGSLVVSKIGKEWRIIGVHMAGTGEWGFANLIPGTLEAPTEELIFSAKAQNTPDHYFDFYDSEVVSGSNLACVGSCKPTCYIRVPKKTSLVKTPETWHLGTTVVKEPSILTGEDHRLGSLKGEFDPFTKGLQKFSNSMGPLDEEILAEVVTEMGDEWYDCIDDDDQFGDVPISVALNGLEGVEYFDSLVLGTSEGFPHNLERSHGEKGKSRFVQGEIGNLSLVPGCSVEKAYNHLVEVVKTEVPTLYGIECPKDELLPLRKIYNEPKTRLFTVLPMEYNILIRQQYLNFVKFTMRHRRTLACKVGTNPYSREWDQIASSLLEKGNDILCCDYSSFDGLCSKQMLEAILGVIQKVTRESGEVWEGKRNTLLAACSRFSIAQARIWRVEGGIPSGIPLTVILNSMMNEILIRYYFKKRFYQEPQVRYSFSNFVSLAVYGDDNLISVHSSCKELFTGKYLQEEMLKDRIKITDGVDKTLPTLNFRRLEESDFLKRKFVLGKDGIYVGPLEKSSLWGQLHYVREGGANMIEAYLVNAENVCRELFLHSKEASASFRQSVLKLGIFPAKMFPNMSQIESFFDEQRGNRAGNFNLSVDVMLNPELLGSLTVINDPGQHHTHTLVPNITYSSVKNHKSTPGEFSVLCGTYGEDGADSVVVRFPYGIGRGGLPTAQWLRENFMRKDGNLRKRLMTEYRKGRSLVFLSANGNTIAMVMAVLFCLGSNIIDVDISNVALAAAVQKCKELGFLARDMPELFTGSG